MKVNYYNKEICVECGGKCCKSMPCTAFPQDFGLPDTKKLREALLSENWCFDWWEGDPRKEEDDNNYEQHGCSKIFYFVRPSTITCKGKLLDPTWGGICIFLEKDGCVLKDEFRPRGGRLLEPSRNTKKCNPHGGGKREAAIKWFKYNDILCKLIREFEYDRT